MVSEGERQALSVVQWWQRRAHGVRFVELGDPEPIAEVITPLRRWEIAALLFLGPSFAPALAALRSFSAWADRLEARAPTAERPE